MSSMNKEDTKEHNSTFTSDQSSTIEVNGLTKKYEPHVLALDGLTFSVQKGEIFGVLGPNGAGKSTAVKVMTTLSRPDRGEVRLSGMDVTRHPKEARKLFGCVSQRSGVDGGSTGRENLMLQGRLYGLRWPLLQERVAELLDRFDLTVVADRLSNTFSGGMQRKLDLAMGLIHGPHILFLDEPTTGLDPEARANLWEIINRLANEERLTVVLTTHYLEEADQLCDRLAIIDRGKVVVEGTAEGLKGELEGDMVYIEAAEFVSESQAREILQDIPNLHEIIAEDQSLYVRTNCGAETIPMLMSTLEAAGMKVQAAKISRPSLDDVYLRYTGRTFAEVEKEEG